MRLLSAASVVLAMSATANARLYRMGIPQTIKPGEVFNATVEQLAGIPLQYYILFGIEIYDEEWDIAPRPGSLGSIFMNAFDLQREYMRFDHSVCRYIYSVVTLI